MLTHEYQNPEMALIRCPTCDTLHDLEGSFFASGARKVRCASCRTIWEATDPESSMAANVVIPKLDPNRERPTPRSKPRNETEAEAALDQAAIDAIDFSEPEPEPEPAAPESAEISAEELEALFADEARSSPDSTPEPAAGPEAVKPASEPIEFDPASLARVQDAASRAAGDEASEDRRRMRRAQRLAATEAHHRGEGKRKSSNMTVMLMAAGFGTLATLGILRNETVRLFPASAPVFEAVGLSVTARGLDISDVKSRLLREENRETLEVSGTIVNLTQTAQKIPVMRLSIRAGSGQEIYVWTASADMSELAPGEKTVFRRRLASPPAESHSVMVRFVAKDDIVAAIR